jgi:asparagine synthase (glutamine-hydrolysing)
VLWRKKSPYPKTWDPKYRTLVSAKLQALLDKKDAPVFQILSQNAVRTLLEKELTWPWYGQLMGTPQTMAYILQMNVWMEHYMVQIR